MTPQFQSFVRWLLNAVSGAVLSYTATKSPAAQGVGAFLANLITGPDVVAACVLGLTWLWGHVTHAQTASASSNGSASKLPLTLLVAMLALPLGLSTGCNTTPQAAAYRAAGSTAVTVEAALAAYDQFAAAGKTTPAQNAAVKDAFLKYQRAFAVVCDAGAVYAATGQTNAPAASLALQTAVANANQSISDIVSLVKSFGVKL
jgi:hypothetical protein